jgi:hypothetical protein
MELLDSVHRVGDLRAEDELIVEQICQAQGVKLIRFVEVIAAVVDADQVDRQTAREQEFSQRAMVVAGNFHDDCAGSKWQAALDLGQQRLDTGASESNGRDWTTIEGAMQYEEIGGDEANDMRLFADIDAKTECWRRWR